MPKADIKADVLLLWDVSKLGAEQTDRAADILKYVRAGGRLVLTDHKKWTWRKLLDLEIKRVQKSWTWWMKGPASRAFAYKGFKHQLLAGVDPENLKRWNGVPGTISDGWIEGKALERADKLLWQDRPELPVAVSLPMGKGEVVICLLHLKQRFRADQRNYDPTAERMLVNLLAPKNRGKR